MSATTKVELELLVGVSATVYPLRDLSAASTRVRACRGPNLGGAWNYVVNEAFGNCVAPFLGKMDVYHPTLYWVMPGVRARSVVATHHDCTQERFPQEFRYVDKVMRAKKSLYAQADGIIASPNGAARSCWISTGVDQSKTRVIYHGLTRLPLSPGAVARVREKVRREYLLSSDRALGTRTSVAC